MTLDLDDVFLTPPARVCLNGPCKNKLSIHNKNVYCNACITKQKQDEMNELARKAQSIEKAERERARKPKAELVVKPARKIRKRPKSMECERCGGARHRGRCKGAARFPNKNLAAAVDVHVAMDQPMRPPPQISLAEGLIHKAEQSPQPARKRGDRIMDKLVATEVDISEIPTDAPLLRRPVGRIGEAWEKMLKLAPGKALLIENRSVPHAGMTCRQLTKKAKKAKREITVKRVGTSIFAHFTAEPGNAEAKP